MRCCKLVEQCTEQKACAACCNWSLAHETVFRCNLGCLQVLTSTPTFRSCHFLKENLKITNMVTQKWTVSFLHDTAVFMYIAVKVHYCQQLGVCSLDPNVICP